MVLFFIKDKKEKAHTESEHGYTEQTFGWTQEYLLIYKHMWTHGTHAKTLLPISHLEEKDNPVLCELHEKVVSNSTFKPVSCELLTATI